MAWKDLSAWDILGLVRRAQAGDERAFEELLAEFDPLLRYVMSRYFLAGGDDDDLYAEARFGFWKAVSDYRPSGGANFRSFVILCVERQIITAVKTASRGKHRPLTGAARVVVSEGGETISVVDLLPDSIRTDPCTVLIRKEEVLRVLSRIADRLTGVEREALLGIASGLSYKQLERLGHGNSKRIDNAAQRARRKLKMEGALPQRRQPRLEFPEAA